MTPRLEIVVDELVVRGLDPEAARVAAAALEARLAELAAVGGTLLPRAEAFRSAPAVDVPAGSPAGVGEAAAAAVWSTLAGSRR